MLNVQVVLDSRTIGGSTMLIPFEVAWLGEHTCRQLPSTTPVQDSIDIDVSDDDENPFITAYIQSIQLAKDGITGQWKECVWDQKNLNIELPATTREVWVPNTLSCPIKLAMP